MNQNNIQNPGGQYRDRRYYQEYPQPYYQEVRTRSNCLGTAGFVLSLIGFVFAILFLVMPYWGLVFIPVVVILLVLGFVFSSIGLFRSPKGLAITGFIISLLGIIGLFISSVATINAINTLLR